MSAMQSNCYAALAFRVTCFTQPEHECPLLQTLLSIIHRLGCWVIGQPIQIESVNLTQRRPDLANELNMLFKAPVRFDQPTNSMVFSQHYLQLANQQSEQSLELFLSTPACNLCHCPTHLTAS
jgi:hypothetical protein